MSWDRYTDGCTYQGVCTSVLSRQTCVRSSVRMCVHVGKGRHVCEYEDMCVCPGSGKTVTPVDSCGDESLEEWETPVPKS